MCVYSCSNKPRDPRISPFVQSNNDATEFAHQSCSLKVTKAAESLDTTSGCKLLAREEQSFHS